VDRRRINSGAPRPQRPAARIDLDDVIYGIHAVNEALAAGETLKRIHVGDDRKRDPALRPLLDHAREAAIAVRYENRTFFNAFPYKAHQSVVAFGASFEYITLEEAIAARPVGKPGLWVVLDHVTDPHNVGAIIRSAECVGATALILPERRSAGVNATVRKAAAGAAAYLPIARVSNVAQSVRALKKAGIWVAAAAVAPTSTTYTAADFNRDLAIVIGAEGDGVSQLVQRECDYLVSIPLEGKVSSLNASVAAAILFYEALRQRTVASRS
jgi:23S rRNA (guanosine2251-2'-O)-methyltransferase